MTARLVLVTRPADDAGALQARLAAQGWHPVLAPLFTVAGTPIAMPDPIQAVLVTSGNAVAHLPATTLPVFAVGDTTAERARARGFRQVESASGDAAALARLAAQRLDPRAAPLLLATGAGQGHGLAADLRARGFVVVRRVCYRASPVRRFPEAATAAILSRQLHAALFLSAETARTFVRLLPRECNDALTHVAALAIGESTADALAPIAWLRISRASTPTLDGVLALI